MSKDYRREKDDFDSYEYSPNEMGFKQERYEQNKKKRKLDSKHMSRKRDQRDYFH